MQGASQNTPPVLERYETKFVIPESMIDPISDFASVYCSLDTYSLKSQNYFYRVNNLYFDTPYYLFLRNRLDDCENRFNMRVRSYGDCPGLPYFLEIKQKKADFLRKYRGRVYEPDWYKLLGPGEYTVKGDNPRETANINLFKRLANSYDVAPVVLSQYVRKAYVSDYEEYARLTFDIDLRYMEERTCNLCPVEERMTSYDHEIHFEPGCNVILELKSYTTHVPLWMMDLIRTFDLQVRGFSKYATGAAEVLGLFAYDNTYREPGIELW